MNIKSNKSMSFQHTFVKKSASLISPCSARFRRFFIYFDPHLRDRRSFRRVCEFWEASRSCDIRRSKLRARSISENLKSISKKENLTGYSIGVRRDAHSRGIIKNVAATTYAASKITGLKSLGLVNAADRINFLNATRLVCEYGRLIVTFLYLM